MIDLSAALRGVVAVLDETQIEYLVVGSVAAAAWGVARMTRDVDAVAVLTPGSLSMLAEQLDPAAFYLPMESARRAVADGGTFNVLHLPTGGKVDLFVVPSSDSFTRSRLARRVRANVLGVETWVASPEDVILAKLRWRRESRSEVQWRDCVEISAVNRLDVGYLCHWAPLLGVDDDLDELLAATGEAERGDS